MSRIRNIRPSFFRHRKLQELENKFPELRPMLVYAGLWTQADKQGVFIWEADQLSLDILPFINNPRIDIEKALSTLAAADFIQEYWVDNEHYGFIPRFVDYQRISGNELRFPAIRPLPHSPGSSLEVPVKFHGSTKPGNGAAFSNQESVSYTVKLNGSSNEVPVKQNGVSVEEQDSKTQDFKTQDYKTVDPHFTVENAENQNLPIKNEGVIHDTQHGYTRIELARHLSKTLQLTATPVLTAAISEAIRNVAKTVNISEYAAHDELLKAAAVALADDPALAWLDWFRARAAPRARPDDWKGS